MEIPLKQTYRISFTSVFLWILLVFSILDWINRGLLGSFQWKLAFFFENIEPISAFDMILSLLIVWIVKSELDPEGIHSNDIWGRSLFIQWNDIAEAKSVFFLGLRFYAIRDRTGNCIYISRFLTHQREFEAIASAISGENNPLRTCIAKHGIIQLPT